MLFNTIEGKIFRSMRRIDMKINGLTLDVLHNLAECLDREDLPLIYPNGNQEHKISYNKLKEVCTVKLSVTKEVEN